jgi:anti-sigma regulatory factor (Ser/Thr protein kinase)
MRTDRIPSDDRAATGARPWRVDHSGPGAAGGPDAPAPGGAARPALSVWPPGPPRTPEGSDPRPGRGPGPGRPSPRHFPGDEVELELSFGLPNNTVVIPAVLARLRERADQFGLFDEKTADRVAVALTEALVNGIQHGNLELDSRLRREDEATYDRMAEYRRRRPPYRDRRLHVRARLSRRQAVYVIRDEGPGFDPATLPDPTDPSHLERTTGRGLLLIRAYMDGVAFNWDGNQITLTKRRTTPPDAHDM